jgi:hypothetical protein
MAKIVPLFCHILRFDYFFENAIGIFFPLALLCGKKNSTRLLLALETIWQKQKKEKDPF